MAAHCFLYYAKNPIVVRKRWVYYYAENPQFERHVCFLLF